MTQARRPLPTDMPAIFEGISEGESLRAVCRKLGLHAPSTHDFIEADEKRREQYVRAKEQRAEHFQEQVITIATAAALGRKVSGEKVDPAGARVFLDTIKWAAARMAPKTAPTQKHAHSFEDLTDDELERRIAALEAVRDENGED